MPEELELLRINIILPEDSEDILALAPKDVDIKKKDKVKKWIEKSFKNLETLKLNLGGELDAEGFFGMDHQNDSHPGKVLLCVYSKDKIKLSSFIATLGNISFKPSTGKKGRSIYGKLMGANNRNSKLQLHGRFFKHTELVRFRKILKKRRNWPDHGNLRDHSYPTISYDMLNYYKPYVVDRKIRSKPILKSVSAGTSLTNATISAIEDKRYLHRTIKRDNLREETTKPINYDIPLKVKRKIMRAKSLNHIHYSSKKLPKTIFINRVTNKNGKQYYYEVKRNKNGKRQCNVYVTEKNFKKVCSKCNREYGESQKNYVDKLEVKKKWDESSLGLNIEEKRSYNILDTVSLKRMEINEQTSSHRNKFIRTSNYSQQFNENRKETIVEESKLISPIVESTKVQIPSNLSHEKATNVSSIISNVNNKKVDCTEEKTFKVRNFKLSLQKLFAASETKKIKSHFKSTEMKKSATQQAVQDSSGDVGDNGLFKKEKRNYPSKSKSKTLSDKEVSKEKFNTSYVNKDDRSDLTHRTCYSAVDTREVKQENQTQKRNIFMKLFARSKPEKTAKSKDKCLKYYKNMYIAEESGFDNETITNSELIMKEREKRGHINGTNLEFLDQSTQSSLEGASNVMNEFCDYCGNYTRIVPIGSKHALNYDNSLKAFNKKSQNNILSLLSDSEEKHKKESNDETTQNKLINLKSKITAVKNFSLFKKITDDNNKISIDLPMVRRIISADSIRLKNNNSFTQIDVTKEKEAKFKKETNEIRIKDNIVKEEQVKSVKKRNRIDHFEKEYNEETYNFYEKSKCYKFIDKSSSRSDSSVIVPKNKNKQPKTNKAIVHCKEMKKVKSKTMIAGNMQLPSLLDIVKSKAKELNSKQSIKVQKKSSKNDELKPFQLTGYAYDDYKQQIIKDVLRCDGKLTSIKNFKKGWVKINSDLEVKEIIEGSSSDESDISKSSNVILKRLSKVISTLTLSSNPDNITNVIKDQKRTRTDLFEETLEKSYKDNRKFVKKCITVSRDRAKLSLVERKIEATRTKLNCCNKRNGKESVVKMRNDKDLNGIDENLINKRHRQRGKRDKPIDRRNSSYSLFKSKSNDDLTRGGTRSKFNNLTFSIMNNYNRKRREVRKYEEMQSTDYSSSCDSSDAENYENNRFIHTHIVHERDHFY